MRIRTDWQWTDGRQSRRSCTRKRRYDPSFTDASPKRSNYACFFRNCQKCLLIFSHPDNLEKIAFV